MNNLSLSCDGNSLSWLWRALWIPTKNYLSSFIAGISKLHSWISWLAINESIGAKFFNYFDYNIKALT